MIYKTWVMYRDLNIGKKSIVDFLTGGKWSWYLFMIKILLLVQMFINVVEFK